MSSSTVQKICKFCKKSYTGKDHKHERTCRFYVWDIPHHFATKQGPMIHITRRANDRHIFCKCVNSSGEKCDRTFASKSGLDKHLNNVKPVYWVVCELNRTYASPCQPLCQAPDDLAAVLASQEQEQVRPPPANSPVQEQIRSPLIDPMDVDPEQLAGSSFEPVGDMLLC